ncbi:MAG: ferritin-like domain-containing protein [Nitrospira sp.]
MATREELLMQWLRDAHAMEKQAIESIENQITRLENYPQMQAWARDHVAASNRQRDMVRQCIERRGGDTSAFKDMAMTIMGNIQEATSFFTSDEVLKNAITDHGFKQYEIASYTSLRSAAEAVGDTQTAQVLDTIIHEEEELAGRLLAILPQVTREYMDREATGAAAKR